MRDQVYFGEPGTLHIPGVGLHRNLMLEQIARLGAPVKAPPLLGLLGSQPPIDLPRTDPQQLPLDLRPQTKVFADPRWQQRLQAHRPGVSRRFPRRRQYAQGFGL